MERVSHQLVLAGPPKLLSQLCQAVADLTDSLFVSFAKKPYPFPARPDLLLPLKGEEPLDRLEATPPQQRLNSLLTGLGSGSLERQRQNSYAQTAALESGFLRIASVAARPGHELVREDRFPGCNRRSLPGQPAGWPGWPGRRRGGRWSQTLDRPGCRLQPARS